MQALLDLVKAFETIPHDLLFNAAREKGYSLVILRLSIASYRLWRVVGIGGIFSRRVQAVRGITAGSGFATSELRLLLQGVIERVQRNWSPSLVGLKLYVDDLTIAVSGVSAAWISRLLAVVVDFIVHILQVELRLEVSAKKSKVVASRGQIAVAAAAHMRSRKAKPASHAKLLGTGVVGGRRRSTYVMRVRLHHFSKTISRYHSLRSARVNTKQMVRAAGTPALLYGVEVVGLTNSALQTMRSRVAIAAAPQAGGKNPDLTLYALDGSCGTLDPAFDCHAMPLKHWALAWWESWFSPMALEESFRVAQLKIAASSSPWRLVAGPVSALIASMSRIGWSFPSAREAVDDLGASWSFILDSPAAITMACRRSVRRWRLARVIKALPSLQPQGLDLDTGNSAGNALLVDFAGPLQSLLQARTAKVPSVPEWRPSMKGDLASAISGGQWTQTRRASVPRWQVTDTRCQLCLAATGTLEHRFECSRTMPADGWPTYPPKAELAIQRVGHMRAQTLRTRGLLVMRLPSPQQKGEGWFKWLVAPGPECDESFTWYFDGSMHDGDWAEYRAVGFGIVVVAPNRSLVAYGLGVPPSWCKSAAAAEAWALHVALRENPFLPKLRTDCQSLLATAREGAAQATGPARPLARIWSLITSSLDGRIETIVERGHLVWMPAHQPLSAIGSAVLSNGKLLSGVDWRANRLVDALAKQAATTVRAPREVRCLLESGRAAVKHAAALLAVVTHAANHHKEPVQRRDGTWSTRCMRDAQQPAAGTRRQPRQVKPPAEPAPLPPASPSRLAAIDIVWHAARPYKRKCAASAACARKKRSVGRQADARPPTWPVRIIQLSSCRRGTVMRPPAKVLPMASAAACALETACARQAPKTAEYHANLQSCHVESNTRLAYACSAEQRSSCAPDPMEDLKQLHEDGFKVSWPQVDWSDAGNIGPPSEVVATLPAVPHDVAASSNLYQTLDRIGSCRETAVDVLDRNPSLVTDGSEVEAAMDDLAFLDRCGVQVVWPRDARVPRRAGSAGR